MAGMWIIRVEGKEYGPADLETLQDWKADGRVLESNPARRVETDFWQTAADIPGLFRAEPPPVQTGEGRASGDSISDDGDRRSDLRSEELQSRPPRRNVFVETFRIYFRGFFQFVGLALLGIVPILSAEFTSRFIDTAPGVNVDLRTLVAGLFTMCMFGLRLALIPVYIAGIQILTVELATGNRIGFFSVLNGAVKFWPRVAGLGLFVWGVFLLLFIFAFGILLMVVTSSSLVSIAIALGLLAVQVWLFARFFINVLFWQQFAVLENANAYDAFRQSRTLARSGADLPWYQRPMWRGAFIVSLWMILLLGLGFVVLWPRLAAEWPVYQSYFNELAQTQDAQAVLQKIQTNLQTSPAGVDYRALLLNIIERILYPILGIAFVVLYLDCKGETES